MGRPAADLKSNFYINNIQSYQTRWLISSLSKRLFIFFFFFVSWYETRICSSFPVNQLAWAHSSQDCLLLDFFVVLLSIKRHATSSLFLFIFLKSCDYEWLKMDFDTIIRPKMKIIDKHESEFVGFGLNFMLVLCV